MQFNLKTTLRAMPKLSPSILRDYVTKEELEEKNYVNHTELDTILQDFVKEVEFDGDNIIYGRVKGKWVPIVDIPEQSSGILCWGMTDAETLTPEQMLSVLSRQNYIQNVNEYSVEATPTENSYFWFTSTIPIKCITADNGLKYRQAVVEMQKIDINYKGEQLTFHVYRTNKLVALPGITYRFEVSV